MLSKSTNQIEQIIGEVRALSVVLTSNEHNENIDISHYANITSLLLYLIKKISNKTSHMIREKLNNVNDKGGVLDVFLGYLEKSKSYLTISLSSNLSNIDIESHFNLISRLTCGIEESFNQWCASNNT